MSLDLPPSGPQLDFFSFATRVNALLRAALPAIVTTRAGEPLRIVRWRYLGRTAVLTLEGDVYRFTFISDAGGNMPSLYAGARKDDFVARNLAQSIAGFFDAELSRKRII